MLSYSGSNATDQIPDVDYNQSIIPQDHNTQISLDLDDEGIMERSYQETLEGVSYSYDDDKKDELEELELNCLYEKNSREVDDHKLRSEEEKSNMLVHEKIPFTFLLEFEGTLL